MYGSVYKQQNTWNIFCKAQISLQTFRLNLFKENIHLLTLMDIHKNIKIGIQNSRKRTRQQSYILHEDTKCNTLSKKGKHCPGQLPTKLRGKNRCFGKLIQTMFLVMDFTQAANTMIIHLLEIWSWENIKQEKYSGKGKRYFWPPFGKVCEACAPYHPPPRSCAHANLRFA